MAEVIPQITVDSSKVKNTWVQNEVVTNDVYNAINKAVIDLKNNNNLLDTNAILFREQYNSSSKNLNNAIHQGIYSFTSSAVNAPSGVTGGNLFVTNTSKINQGSSVITQIAFCHNGAVYARTKNNSENFTSWNKLAYITDTVARAISDNSGQQITTTYLNRSRGYVTEDFNNVTTEGIYGFGNSHKNRPFNYGRLLVLNSQLSGTGADIFWIWQLAFKTHGGNLMLRSKTNREEWTAWKTIPFTDSPALTGTPTAPTPSSSDNSTKLATTAFVNNYAPSKSGNGATGTWKINITGNAGTATKSTQDSRGQQIDTTYVKGVTGSNATLTITKGNGTTSQVTINNVANATNATNATNSKTVNVAQRFKFGAGGSGVVYRIFARTSLTAGNRYGNSTFIITSTGNFGSNLLGSYIVNISNRGSSRMYVRELIPDDSNSTTFGYYQSGSYLYFGLSNTAYSGECSVTPLNVSYYGGHEVGNYKNDSTVPSGWRNVTIEKLAPKASPAFSGTPTAPTPSTSDNSTRIATTSFVHSLVDTKNDVYIGAGTGSVKNTSFTIPLPSGYSRGQCKYAIFPTSHTIDTNNAGWYTLNVNQGTGVVSGAISYDATGGGSVYGQISFGYVVIAVK